MVYSPFKLLGILAHPRVYQDSVLVSLDVETVVVNRVFSLRIATFEQGLPQLLGRDIFYNGFDWECFSPVIEGNTLEVSDLKMIVFSRIHGSVLSKRVGLLIPHL